MIRSLMTSIATAALFSAPIAPAFANDSAEIAAPESQEQHAVWTEILQKYVIESEDGLNRFDYGGLKDDADDVAALDAYLASFADMDFEAMSDEEAFVAYGNAYNALTIQHIVGRFPVNSIRSGYLVGPWKQVKMNVGGEELSLDDIEHGVLRAQWDEPRIHYMVNCASFGCPNLKSTAWEVDTLEEDLEEAAHAYINHPRGVTIRRNGTLQVSTIYKWFREDFGGDNAGVIEHILEYAEPELADQIRANPRITKHAYDWSLNGVE